jgi:hypothetical protein
MVLFERLPNKRGSACGSECGFVISRSPVEVGSPAPIFVRKYRNSDNAGRLVGTAVDHADERLLTECVARLTIMIEIVLGEVALTFVTGDS